MIERAAKCVEVFIPNERMGEFNRRIAQMHASAKRLDLPAWEVIIGEPEWRSVSHPDDRGSMANSRYLQIEGKSVAIVGAPTVLAGWRFVAKIEHAHEGNLIKKMAEDVPLSLEWHTCAANCDHCKVSRPRSNTYMLQNDASGEIKQVGSSCVQDFLGIYDRDPERIAALYGMLADIGRDFEFDAEREENGILIEHSGVSPEWLMATTLKIIEEDGGFIAAQKAEAQGVLSTGQAVRTALWGRSSGRSLPTTAQIESARPIVAWLKDQKVAESVWLRNIAYLAERSNLRSKDAGLFASGYVAWNRHFQQQLKAERDDGDWIGTVGEKIVVAATLERRGGFETAFGFKSVLTFRDDVGNALVWKTQSVPLGLIVGSTYHLMTTVNGHGLYNAEKQTDIARTKIAELDLFSFGPLAGYKKLAAIASPDVVDERGHTPLILALWHDDVDHARVLLEAGADANQLNQGEVPALAYAASPAMAQLLLAHGARPTDVQGEWLQGMVPEAREVVLAASPLSEVVKVNVVETGRYHGMVTAIEAGVVTQKINRGGDTVCHDVERLTAAVQVGDVVEISYNGDRRGLVKGAVRESALGR